MSLEIFARDVVPILGLIVATFGFIIMLRQIKFASASMIAACKSVETSTDALVRNTAWNQTLAAYNFFDYHKNVEDEILLVDSLEDEKVKFKTKLSAEELQILESSTISKRHAKNLLNDIERYCAAIQTGAVDDDLAFHLYHERFIRKYDVMSPFIDSLRSENNADELLIEFEKTALNWKLRKQKVEHQKKLKETQKMALENKGLGVTANSKLG